MPWPIYDYVDDRGVNVIKVWSQRQDSRQRAKLNQKLDRLEQNGPDLCPGLVTTPKGHIRKLRVQGNPKLRPLLCIGPIHGEDAITLLVGTNEVQWELDVADAYELANRRRSAVIANPNARRRRHERVA
jgi:hypothetical protein